MFDTFILQYLDKLIKREVGDFTSPQAFHSVYVQRFKSKRIKAPTEVGGEFPMPVKTLPADFPIQYRQLTHCTPPVIRTLFLTRKAFIQHAELFQGLLKKLWTLYLFACGKFKYASFIPNCATGTICLCFTLSAPTLSPVVGNGSVEVSSVVIQNQQSPQLSRFIVIC